MRNHLYTFSLVCLLASAAVAHADVVYTSASTYNAATTAQTTATFNGIAPSGSFVNETPSFTTAGATFTSAGTSLLFVIDPGYYGSTYAGGGFLSSDYNVPTDLLNIAFPSSTSVAFNFGGLLGPTTSFLATLSDGFSFTFSTADSIGGTNTLDFIGFTSSTAITGLTLTLPDTPGYSAIDNLSYGKAGTSPVPEPSSLVLLGTGAFTLIETARRKSVNKLNFWLCNVPKFCHPERRCSRLHGEHRSRRTLVHAATTPSEISPS